MFRDPFFVVHPDGPRQVARGAWQPKRIDVYVVLGHGLGGLDAQRAGYVQKQREHLPSAAEHARTQGRGRDARARARKPAP